MTATTYVIAALVVLIGVWGIARLVHVIRIVLALRGPRVVACPETGQPTGVTVDLRYAVRTGLRQHTPCVRVRACSRRTERGRCSESCVSQAADSASTPRAIVTGGVTGQPCAYCRRAIAHVAFLDHYAAFLQPDGSTIEWPQVPPERLRDTIAARPPVCWDCHVAETFRRKYPELVTDRPWPRV
jgi:hypothetical protein